MIDNMAEVRASNIRRNLSGFFNSELDCIMTTKDRIDLLQRTVDSYMEASELPAKIKVFDDNSEYADVIPQIVGGMPGVELIPSKASLGVGKKTPAVLKEMFEKGSKAVLILDSDTLFYKNWHQGANAIYNELKADEDFGALSLYNGDFYYPSKKSKRHPAVREANQCGAFGLIVTKAFYEKYIAPLDQGNWDRVSTNNAAKDGKKIYVASPCFLQHIGYEKGSHTSRQHEPNVSTDFLGLMQHESVERRAVPDLKLPAKGQVNTGSRLLWACFARRGDILAASVIANYLIDRGYKLTWLTLPMHMELTELVCPRCCVKGEGYADTNEWYYMSSEEMRQKYSGFDAYINAQFGAPENHDVFADAEPNMLEWLLRRVSEILGIKYTCDDWKPYFRLQYDKQISLQNMPLDKPLAIIAPGGHSSPVLTEQNIEDLTKKLSEKYYVRQLVTNMPNGLSARERREKYISGLTFMESIFFLRQHCHYFVGNNSGLAWASMYSNCLKQIWHRRHTEGNRIVRAGTYFSKIDKNAEDILGDM